jgi:hypothetical protein
MGLISIRDFAVRCPVGPANDKGPRAPRAGSARGVFNFSTDFRNSFESHPSRKPFPSTNLNPTVSNSPHPFESLHSYHLQPVPFELQCFQLSPWRRKERLPLSATFLSSLPAVRLSLPIPFACAPMNGACPDPVGVTARYCFKSFSCNTYGSPRKYCKQKTYGLAKSFRCNTYKEHTGGCYG